MPNHPRFDESTRRILGGARPAVALLALHTSLLAYLATRHSPTIHELGHLPAGICHWQYGMFELYRVNPPLPRMAATLPVLFCNPKTDWANYQLDPIARETIPMGVRFAKANGERTLLRRAVGLHSILSAWRVGLLSLGQRTLRRARRPDGALPLVLPPNDSGSWCPGHARRPRRGDGIARLLAVLEMAPRTHLAGGVSYRAGARRRRTLQVDAVGVHRPMAGRLVRLPKIVRAPSAFPLAGRWGYEASALGN